MRAKNRDKPEGRLGWMLTSSSNLSLYRKSSYHGKLTDHRQKCDDGDTYPIYFPPSKILPEFPDSDSKLITQSKRSATKPKTGFVKLVFCVGNSMKSKRANSEAESDRFDQFEDCDKSANKYPCEKLQSQYERWLVRARYKISTDPTKANIIKNCCTSRKISKSDRILFHYCGFGVPGVTENGELWAFNTQSVCGFVPISWEKIVTSLGYPAVYVMDCDNAGRICELARNIDQRAAEKNTNYHPVPLSYDKVETEESLFSPSLLVLACCSSEETPLADSFLPRDLFESCLTLPVKTSIKWFHKNFSEKYMLDVTPEMLEMIPGSLNDRRTPLGELNWIFTSITDTIAWNVLPSDLFQQLYRHDHFLASIFRNFLLAQRLMYNYDYHVSSYPPLTMMNHHRLWQVWDLTLRNIFEQIGQIIKNPTKFINFSFFEDQLTAFDVWLSVVPTPPDSPEQLPILLQVLLNQKYRLRAVDLLCRYLDSGRNAIMQACRVGITPYCYKLMIQDTGFTLRPYMLFVWAKILSVDMSIQTEITQYIHGPCFTAILINNNSIDSTTMTSFILTRVMQGHKVAQVACLKESVISSCLVHLDEMIDGTYSIHLLWPLLCVAMAIFDFPEARWCAVRCNAVETLAKYHTSEDPEIKAASLFAIGNIVTEQQNFSEHSCDLDKAILFKIADCVYDSNPMIRQAVLFVTISIFIKYSFTIMDYLAHRSSLGSSGVTSIIQTFKNLLEFDSQSSTPSHQADSVEQECYKILLSCGRLSSKNMPPVVVYLLLFLAMDPDPKVSIHSKVLIEVLESLNFHYHLVPSSSLSLESSPEVSDSDAGGKGSSSHHHKQISREPSQSENSGSESFSNSINSQPEDYESDISSIHNSFISQKIQKVRENILFSFVDQAAGYFSNSVLKPMDFQIDYESDFQQQASSQRSVTKSKIMAYPTKSNFALHSWKVAHHYLNLDRSSRFVRLAAYDPYCIIFSATSFTIYNWEKRRILKTVSICDVSHEDDEGIESHAAQISSATILNEYYKPKMLILDSDGVIKLWAGIMDVERGCKLQTAWRACCIQSYHENSNFSHLPSHIIGPKMDWNESHGTLFVSSRAENDESSISVKLWDLNRQSIVSEKLFPVENFQNKCIISTSYVQSSRRFYLSLSDNTLAFTDIRECKSFQRINKCFKTVKLSEPCTLFSARESDYTLHAVGVSGKVYQIDSRKAKQEFLFSSIPSNKKSAETYDLGEINMWRKLSVNSMHPIYKIVLADKDDGVYKLFDSEGRSIFKSSVDFMHLIRPRNASIISTAFHSSLPLAVLARSDNSLTFLSSQPQTSGSIELQSFCS